MKLSIRRLAGCAVLAFLTVLCNSLFPETQEPAFEASICVDASKRIHKLSPLLYGHFTEFMFEDIKGGMWAELLRNWSFEETAPRPSVAHYWEPYPDNRNAPPLQFGGERDGYKLSEAGYPTTYSNRAQILLLTFADPTGGGIYHDNVTVRTSRIKNAGGEFVYSFEKYSVTVITLH